MTNRFLIVCGGTGYRLLGQRTVLGIDAEIQIDVSKENVSKNWKVKDQRSLYVDLDQRVGTTAVAFNEVKEKLASSPKHNNEPEKAHSELLVEQFPAARTLEWGLSQSPAVGKAAIAHKFNRTALEKSVRDMITQYGRDIGPENPVDVWIISSTAGGTGEGTHRFVGATLAEFVCNTFSDTPLSINFIRVGQLTYRSVNNHKTALNTFFGVAADAAFMLDIKKKHPLAVTNWFYLDLPDVGKGDAAKPIRGEIVEMACKSIMLPELQDDIQKLLVNNLGAPIVLVRTGYWGKDFGSQQKYFETLKQLVGKLIDLVEPNYERVYILGRPQPEFIASSLDERISDAQNVKYVLSRMEKAGWSFPNYRLAGVPKSLEPIRILISDWKKSIRDLLEIDLDHISVEFRVDEEISAEGGKRSVPLMVPAAVEENAEWFAYIDNTHRVKAWSRCLLGMDYKDGSILSTGWLADLLRQAEQISRVFHSFDILSSSDKKAAKAAGLLGAFVRTLTASNHLLELEKSATNMLDRELSETRKVLDKADEEYDIVKNSVGTTPSTMVYAAELSHVLDLLSQKTWLRLLRDAVRKGEHDQFRKEVLRGATGLTEEGLRFVLGLQTTADIVDVQNILATNIGQMVDSKGEAYEGAWWQATPPNPTLEYYYRILPQVSRKLREQLRSRGETDNIPYRYIFTEFGTIGLYVLAFHGVSLNTEVGDTSSAPAFLLRPLISHVKQAMANWPKKPLPNTTSGQLEIVTAGAGGEPLYERAMREAGLEDEDIQKISQFYSLYN
ncbi:MAG: hypothetical protein ABIJ39_08410 [Chloroflexota bacterium]